jgi:hypothetical protein
MTPEIDALIRGYAKQWWHNSMAIACSHIMVLQFVRRIAIEKWYIGWDDEVISEINNPFSWPPAIFDKAMRDGMKLPTESQFWHFAVEDISTEELKAIKVAFYVEKR